MSPRPVVLSWSGGKDSAYALHILRSDPTVEVVGLLTTLTGDYDRVSMHGVRRSLLESQASAIGIPLHTVTINAGAGNDSYEEKMRAALAALPSQGIHSVAFGDLFLEDVRRYRENLMEGMKMSAIFPLWGNNTSELAKRFISLGFRAITTCIDTEQLDGRFAGRWFDERLLAELPDGADPCGENGEFHTFVCDGPIFSYPVEIVPGELLLMDQRFLYCDLHPSPPPDDRSAG
ncbi:ATPase [soil metagenome]